MAELDDLTKARLQTALQILSRTVHPVAAYLFGSRAEQRADQWSDYDLAVFIEGAETWDMEHLVHFCVAIQKEAGDDIELHVFPADQAVSPEPGSFASYILKHGIPLPVESMAA